MFRRVFSEELKLKLDLSEKAKVSSNEVVWGNILESVLKMVMSLACLEEQKTWIAGHSASD